MGYPLLLYSLQDVLNPSFEDDDIGDPPSDWTVTTDDMLVDVQDEPHIPGNHALSDVRSCRFRMTSPTGTMSANITQRIAVTDLNDLLYLYGGTYGLVFMMKATSPVFITSNAIRVWAGAYQGGTTTIGSGTYKGLGPNLRGFVTGYGPQWFMYVTTFDPYEGVDYLDIQIGTIIANALYDASAYWYIDRVMLGGVIDFPKGVRTLKGDGDTGYELNQGDGVYEIVRTRNANSKLEIEITNVLECSDFDNQIRGYLASLAMSVPRRCAFWGDRDHHITAERHFEHLITDPKQMKYTYEPGVARRTYSMRFLAPKEYFV